MIYKTVLARNIHYTQDPKTGRVLTHARTSEELAKKLGAELVSREQLVTLIEEAIKPSKGIGGFFTVEFIKRTNGEHRRMNCRGGVKKYLLNGKLPFSPDEKNLFRPVWCTKRRAYRLIPKDTVNFLSHKGKKYVCFT